MNMATDGRSGTDERLRQDVLRLADDVHDPCSIGQGMPLGLAEMGLVADVRVGPAPDGRRAIEVLLRLTAPGCLYWMHFERELRSRLLTLAGVSEVSVVRDIAYDWSPDLMSASARARLERRRSQPRPLPIAPAVGAAAAGNASRRRRSGRPAAIGDQPA